jgi:LPS sulfotransferase NodH
VSGYVICATPRSGSTLLCHLLRSSGRAGHPQSWFRAADRAEYAEDWGIPAGDWGHYRQAAYRAGCDGGPVFGLRLMWDTLEEVEALLGGPLMPGLGLTHAIWLRRGDTVAQAVSRLKAEVSGTWHLGFEEAAHPAAVAYDFDRIRLWRDEAEVQNIQWQEWFARRGVTPLELTYEDLAADPVAVAERALGFLGLPMAAGQRPSASNRPMADAVSADWIARFRAEALRRGC